MTPDDMKREATLGVTPWTKGNPPATGPTVADAGGPGLLGRIGQSLIDPKQYAVLGAEARRGLKDLQSMVLDPFPSGFPQRDEAGTIANPTSQQVTREMDGKDKDIDMDI